MKLTAGTMLNVCVFVSQCHALLAGVFLANSLLMWTVAPAYYLRLAWFQRLTLTLSLCGIFCCVLSCSACVRQQGYVLCVCFRVETVFEGGESPVCMCLLECIFHWRCITWCAIVSVLTVALLTLSKTCMLPLYALVRVRLLFFVCYMSLDSLVCHGWWKACEIVRSVRYCVWKRTSRKHLYAVRMEILGIVLLFVMS